MKYSNLLLSSLLVSTALSTAASAATVALSGDNTIAGTALAVRNISAQAFPVTAVTSTTIGSQRLFIRFGQNTNSAFTGTVNVTGAKFKTAGIATRADAANFDLYGASLPGSIEATSTSACTVLAGVSSLALTCNTTLVSGTVTSSSVNGIVINGISFDNASALSTAGTSVSLDFTMTVNSATFDTAAATTVITSRNSLTGTSTSSTVAKIDSANATGSFLKLQSASVAAVIGSFGFTVGSGSTYGRDLSIALTAAGQITGVGDIKVTSTIFSDDAVANAGYVTRAVAAVQTVTSTQFGAGFVTFAITAANIISTTDYGITVAFNGTKEIDVASAGTTLISFTALAGDGASINVTAPPSITGTVAALSRTGLSIDLNGLQPGTAQGARQYTSLVRVANTGTNAGTVSMVVSNETTGAVLGTYTSASIPAGASLQVSSAQIEAGAGITASASVLYRLALSGNITGYAQHVTWNQDAGFFGDLSARRDATTGTNN